MVESLQSLGSWQSVWIFPLFQPVSHDHLLVHWTASIYNRVVLTENHETHLHAKHMFETHFDFHTSVDLDHLESFVEDDLACTWKMKELKERDLQGPLRTLTTLLLCLCFCKPFAKLSVSGPRRFIFKSIKHASPSEAEHHIWVLQRYLTFNLDQSGNSFWEICLCSLSLKESWWCAWFFASNLTCSYMFYSHDANAKICKDMQSWFCLFRAFKNAKKQVRD